MSFRINGVDDRLRLTGVGVPSENLFTTCGWSYVASNITDTTIQPLFLIANLGLTDALTVMWEADPAGNQFRVARTTGGAIDATADASARPATGIWFHWFARCNGTNFQGGWSGLVDNSYDTASIAAHSGFTEENMNYGNIAGVYWTDCRMAHIRCWDAFLTDDELRLEKYATLPVRIANLSYAWRDISAASVTDFSGQGRDAAILGTPAQEVDPPIDDILHPWWASFGDGEEPPPPPTRILAPMSYPSYFPVEV